MMLLFRRNVLLPCAIMVLICLFLRLDTDCPIQVIPRGLSTTVFRMSKDMKTEYNQLTTRDMRRYVRPQERTAFIEPRNMCGNDPVFLLVTIPSKPSHFKARKAIRSTWGRHLIAMRLDVRLFFALGVPSDHRLLIFNEVEDYGDILLDAFCDSYFNMTIKAVATLKWIVSRCPQAEFIFKLDDDSFVHPANLFSLLSNYTNNYMTNFPEGTASHAERGYILTGYMFNNSIPVRNPKSKWYIPNYIFSGNMYPPYFFGSAVLFSGWLAPMLYEESLKTPFIHIDDAFLTGIVAGERLGLTLHHESRFSVYRTCDLNQVIQEHGFSSDVLASVWNNSSEVGKKLTFKNIC